MSKKELVQTAKQLIASPSCCPELKAVTQRWLDAVGTAEEKEDAHALVLELMEDVNTLDHTIQFFESEQVVQMFGAEQANAMAAHAREMRASGAKWCDCPACTAGVILWKNAESLFA